MNTSVHGVRLTCAGEHIAPELSVRVDLSPSRHCHANRHMCELALPGADYHVRFPGHCSMNRVVPQHQTKGGIIRTCGHAPNRVARVNIFQIDFSAGLLEVWSNAILQIQAHITELNVSGRILLSCSLKEILPRSFRNNYHGVPATL